MKLPAIKPNRLITKLKKAGFFINRITGSHVILYNQTGKIITVPKHNKDLKKGTLGSIIKQSGLGREKFLKLLKK